MNRLILFIVVTFLTPLPLDAWTIYLKDGRVMEADTLETKGNMVNYTVKGIPGILSVDLVDRIEAGPPQTQGKQKPTASSVLNPIATIPESKARADLKANLDSKYPGSYSTQKMLFDAGMRDYRRLCQLPGNSVNNQILRKLSATYYPSFSTIWMLYQHNAKAYKELQE